MRASWSTTAPNTSPALVFGRYAYSLTTESLGFLRGFLLAFTRYAHYCLSVSLLTIPGYISKAGKSGLYWCYLYPVILESFYPGDDVGDDFGRDGFFDFAVFINGAGFGVLEEMIQTFV